MGRSLRIALTFVMPIIELQRRDSEVGLKKRGELSEPVDPYLHCHKDIWIPLLDSVRNSNGTTKNACFQRWTARMVGGTAPCQEIPINGHSKFERGTDFAAAPAGPQRQAEFTVATGLRPAFTSKILGVW
jgi:hypothetical protein